MLKDLNQAQREAVSTLRGPLLVLAGAGTGKTRVVTVRIAELIRQRARPERILGVTFTNKAAAEMQQRCGALLGRRLRSKPEISTFHSLCVRILRRHIEQLGYPRQFRIYDRADQEGLARRALREINVPGETLRPGDLLQLIGRWKTRGTAPQRALSEAATDQQQVAATAYRRYQSSLRAAGAVDFDDLLLLAEELLGGHSRICREEAARFDHLLVDEYQDTSASQYRIIKALAAKHRNLCVVGDDDQSIYAWRGAEVEHILEFQRDWPDAKVVRLEDNYRSRPEILELATTLITYNLKRHDKTLRAARSPGEKPRILQLQDETEEAREVVADIRKLLADGPARPRDMAILFRTNEQPRAFEMELRRCEVPYVLIGGTSFYDRTEVRDVLAYLKLLAEPSDEVPLLRIINTPARGISPSSVAALVAEAVRRGAPLWDVLCDPTATAGIPPAAVQAVENFRRLIDRFRQRLGSGSLVEAVQELLCTIDYRSEVNRTYKEPVDQESRWRGVEEIVNAVGLYERRAESPTLAGFLEETALAGREQEADDKESKLNRDAVALLTLHSAKGLEFPHVYLVGMEEGLLPHHRSIAEGGIDEERRLCYVGVTRAKDRLTLTLALTRQKWGKARASIPSRFLYELTGQADHPNAQAARRGERRPLPQARKPRGSRKRAAKSRVATARAKKTFTSKESAPRTAAMASSEANIRNT